MSEVIDKDKFPKLWRRMQLPVPKSRRKQIHDFATDLAVGFDEGGWDTRFAFRQGYSEFNGELKQSWKAVHKELREHPFSSSLENKWASYLPQPQDMISLGYLRKTGDEYTLTEKALRLVDEAVTPPNVFISYKRSESSAFALLLEARIKYETNAKPYIDKDPELGKKWDVTLEEKVNSCEAFICVIAKTTFDSESVCAEITWAKDSNTQIIIPVCHNGYEIERVNEIFDNNFAVRVKEENAEEYDRAAHKVLNYLGYSPHFVERRQGGTWDE